MRTKIVIGTRKSQLALRQTAIVVQALQRQFPDLTVEVAKITTQGDRDRKSSLQKIGGKGVFVKAIEQQLLNGTIDLAVHSLKDVPPALPTGLALGAILKRASPFDCLVTPLPLTQFSDLPQGARLGTNSSRRGANLRHLRPDLEIVPIRGNVETRLHQIETQHLAGAILAEAGLDRLAIDLGAYRRLSLRHVLLPAAGQGALAVESRANDAALAPFLQAINDPQTAACVGIERDFMAALGGTCSFPIGSYAFTNALGYRFKGFAAAADGQHWFEVENNGPQPAGIGQTAGNILIDQGALNVIQP